MLDYAAIMTLEAIIDTQGFESAAGKLFITQSAVSQRIRSLEKYYGEPVLIRSLPYQPTSLGQALLSHYKKVRLLEDSLMTGISSSQQSPRISLAISRDSLETWFPRVIDQLNTLQPITLEIIADDEEITIDYLRKGLVSACASTSSKEIMGCKATFLGYFDYVLVASPEFKRKYFKGQQNIKKLLTTAPTILFDNQDYLLSRYVQHFFQMEDVQFHSYVVPSVAGFKQFALKSYAYALIPKIDILKELKQKKLINLFPDKIWEMPVYWHTFGVETKIYRNFNDLVLRVAREHLRN